MAECGVDAAEVYCSNGCGVLAVGERINGLAGDGTEVVDLLCDDCLEADR